MSTATLLFEKTVFVGGIALNVTREDDGDGQEKIQAQVTTRPPFISPDQTEIESAISQELGCTVAIVSYQEAESTYLFKRKERAEPAAVETPLALSEPAPSTDSAAPSEAPPAEPHLPAPEPKPIGPAVDRVLQSLPAANGQDLDEMREWEHRVKQQANRCDALDAELKDLESDLAEAKEAVKDKQGEVNEANRELRKLIAGQDEEAPLFNRRPSANGATTSSPHHPLGEEDNSWRDVPLSQLGLPKAILGKLEDADVSDGTRREIKTVGQLADFTKEFGAKGYSVPLTMIRGIGGAANEKVETALSEFWANRKSPPAEPSSTPPTSEDAGITAGPAAASAEAEAPSPATSWRDCSISDLDLSEKHATKLAAANIATVGELADCLRDYPLRITDLVGKRAHDKLVRLVELAASDESLAAANEASTGAEAMSPADKEEITQRLEKKGARRGRGNGKHRPDPKRGAKQAKVKAKLVNAGRKKKGK